jgi:hypothetical protein
VSLIVVGLALSAAPAARAQVPTLQDVTGHAFGERITVHHEMVDYLTRLAEASPRVAVVEQGRSWEGRPFLLAIVTSPENHARIDEIQENSRRLADARTTTPAQARAIIADQPAVVWFGGSIHGFELSGAEGALKLLEHLATRDDPATLAVLQNSVVLIDPMLNPDGRDAFAALNHQNLGREPNPDTRDWGNDFTRWQALEFRTGHYYFDTNRDWFAHTQKETRARMPFLHAWRPQVAVDMHEMGSGNEFYFDPPAEPANPHMPRFVLRWFARFGNAYAAAFDSAGIEYMARERFNYFYPGYTSNRAYQGAVAMLFEQSSSRGFALTRPDGTVRTLATSLEQHYLAAWTAASIAAREREALLTEYHDSQRAAVEEGSQGVRRYLIAHEGDPLLVRELAELLQRNAIEVSVLTEPVSLNGVRDRTGAAVGRRTFDAGTYVVEAAQPAGRLIRTLLEPETPVPEEFLQLARERLDRGASPRFYDVTAWSLPLLFNVGGYSTTYSTELPVQSMQAAARMEQVERAEWATWDLQQAGYAYLLDGRAAASLSALYHLRAQGYRVAVITAATRMGGRDVASGTVIVRVGQNDESVHGAVREAAERFGVGVTPVETGLSDPGYPTLGSGDHTFNAALPKIALFAEGPVRGYSFGWAWYTLDRQYEIPLAVLRTPQFDAAWLAHYNVLVLPSVSGEAFKREIGEENAERLAQWVRDGGTLITIGAATEFARKELKLIALRSWYELEENEEARRFAVPGAILRAALGSSWMASGYSGVLPVLVDSDRIYIDPEGPPSSRRRVVARYVPGAGTRISGHVWTESLERLPGAVFAYEERVGRGRVIAFAEDVNYRGYFRGANRLFLNAVILSPNAP